MSAKVIRDELVEQVGKDLREHYGLDDEDVRRLGARLADDPRVQRRAAKLAFADRFTDEHRQTFERLAK